MTAETTKNKCRICGDEFEQLDGQGFCEACEKILFAIKTLNNSNQPVSKPPKIFYSLIFILYHTPEIFCFLSAVATVVLLMDGHYWLGGAMLGTAFLIVLRNYFDK